MRGSGTVKQLFDREIAKHMEEYGQVEQIKKYRILPDEWSQETGELTPTMKVKRRIINQKSAQVIDEMYK